MTESRASALLTPLELRIMQCLWDGGPGSVAEVQSRLGPPELAYTTVQTMLGVLLKKRKVVRRQVGRAFEWRASISREGAREGALADLTRRMFGGSAEALLMSLIDTRQIDAATIARAAGLLKERSLEENGE